MYPCLGKLQHIFASFGRGLFPMFRFVVLDWNNCNQVLVFDGSGFGEVYNVSSRVFCFAALVGIVVGAEGVARADMLQVSGSYAAATDWSSNTASVSVPQFDPSLGTLTSVVVTFTGSESSTLTVGNISGQIGSPNNSSGTASTNTTFDISSGSMGLTMPTLTVSTGYPFANLPYVSGSNTITGATGSGSASTTPYDVPTAQIGDFVGTGNVSFPASTSTVTGIMYSPQDAVTYALATGDPSASLTATVTYNYTPVGVPEPSSLAMVCAGFAGLIGFIWRKRTARLR